MGPNNTGIAGLDQPPQCDPGIRVPLSGPLRSCHRYVSYSSPSHGS